MYSLISIDTSCHMTNRNTDVFECLQHFSFLKPNQEVLLPEI